MIKPIVLLGKDVLRQNASEVDTNSENTKQLIQDLWDTLAATPGCGLAAPQIGVSSKVFVASIESNNPTKRVGYIVSMEDGKTHYFSKFHKVFVNPKIIEYSTQKSICEEGCLSIPNIHENVERSEAVHIRYFDKNGKEQEEIYGGFVARIIQHEYDHLNGAVFTDKVAPLKKLLIHNKLRKIIKRKIDPSKYETI